MTGKALFIALNGCFFDLFATGKKDIEYRVAGKRWNLKTCHIGRRVTLSRGYGKKNRLNGVIVDAWIETDPEEFDEDFVRIFGTKNINQMSIKIKVEK